MFLSQNTKFDFLSTDLDHFEKEMIFECGNIYYNTFIAITNTKSKEKKLKIINSYIEKLSSEIELSKPTISKGVFNQPVIIFNKSFPQISISHTDNIYSCLVFNEQFPMSIDIEEINKVKSQSILDQLTDFELKNFDINPTILTILWTVKEAASKFFKAGMYADFKIFEILEMSKKDNYIKCLFRNFSHIQSISCLLENIVVTIIYANEARFINPHI